MTILARYVLAAPGVESKFPSLVSSLSNKHQQTEEQEPGFPAPPSNPTHLYHLLHLHHKTISTPPSLSKTLVINNIPVVASMNNFFRVLIWCMTVLCMLVRPSSAYGAMRMGSDTRRRVLKESRYIGYGALEKGRIPCNVRGSSYYNCRGHQPANPYSRGCTKITHCARNNR